jgi:hypothetical protein
VRHFSSALIIVSNKSYMKAKTRTFVDAFIDRILDTESSKKGFFLL